MPKACEERTHTRVSAPVQRLLYADLQDAALGAVVADARRAVNVSLTWNPMAANLQEDDMVVYAALCLRVNILEAMCTKLQQVQWKHASTLYETAHVKRTGKSDRPPAPHEPADAVDELLYYLYAWLDAHLLLCVAFEKYGPSMTDTAPLLAAMLHWCKPGPYTHLTVGDLPDLTGDIMQSELVLDPRDGSPVSKLFSRVLPQRGVTIDVTRLLQADELQTAKTGRAFTLLLVASTLGLYPHARNRPGLLKRIGVYRTYFFHVPANVQTHLKHEAAAARELGASAAGAASGTRKHAKLCDLMRKRGMATSDIDVRLWMLELANSQSVLAVFRDYAIHAMTGLPHLYDAVCRHSSWLNWQAHTLHAVDAARGNGHGIALSMRGARTPSVANARIFQVLQASFDETMVHALAKVITTGQVDNAHSTGGGLDRAADGIFTEELRVLLRAFIFHGPRKVKMTWAIPQSTAELTDMQARGLVPMQAFYVRPCVIREFGALEQRFNRVPAAASVGGFLRFLLGSAPGGEYELQALHCFCEARNQHATTRTVVLPVALATQQVRRLRACLNLDEAAPVPPSFFTAMICPTTQHFCPEVIDDKKAKRLSEAQPLQSTGNEGVSLATVTLEERLLRTLDGRFPSFASTRTSGSVQDYFMAFARNEHQWTCYGDRGPASAAPFAWDRTARWTTTAGAFAPVTPVSERALERQVWAPADVRRAQTRFAELRNRPLVVATGPAVDGRRRLKWVCANKKHGAVKPDGHDAELTERERTAVTRDEQERASASAQLQRWRALFKQQSFARCCAQELWQMHMLGNALVLQTNVYVNCCKCLNYTTIGHAKWAGVELLCKRCFVQFEKNVSSGVRCFCCTASEHLCPVTCLDGTRFTDVYFCRTHARNKKWLFASPVIMTQQEIEEALRAGVSDGRDGR